MSLNFDFVIGDDVYAYSPYSTTGWMSEYRVRGDGTAVLFRGAAGRQIYGMGTDGTALAWCEAYGTSTPAPQQPTVEMWTAPYTNDPAQLAATAKKLVTLPGAVWCSSRAPVFQGFYVTTTTSNFATATVVRLSDGALQQVSAGAGRAFGTFAFDTQTEVWSTMNVLLPGDAGLGLGNIAFVRFKLGVWP